MNEMQKVNWRTARCGNGACVEVGRVDDLYLLRDSKDPDGPTLTFTSAEWQTFAEGVRAGDFDSPD